MSARVVLAVSIFACTLVLVLVRPRGWHEAVWTAVGAAAAWCAGLVGLRDAADVLAIAREPMLFLVTLLVLSKLVERSGFFEWAAAHAARSAGGRGDRLFRNVYVLGALTTVTLSLDTTALLVTPLVLACVRRLGVRPRPYVLACAFACNAGSLLLPISNLTNLLFASRFGVTFGVYVARMLVPQLVALGATYLVLRAHLSRELGPFDPASCGDPREAAPDRAYFRATWIVLASTLATYFVAPAIGVPAYAVTAVACAVLAFAAWRAGRLDASMAREIAWAVVPFALGLFLVVRGLENVGFAALGARALGAVRGPASRVFALAAATGVLSNVTNNLPAALFTRSVLVASNASPGDAAAALVGLDVGPNLLVFASLATMLVLDVARKAGARVGAMDLLRAGLRATPLALALAAACLVLEQWLPS